MRNALRLFGLATGLIASTALADDNPRALMKAVLNRSSWRDMQGNLRLVLQNKRGNTKVREIKLWSKKNTAGESSMLMRFVGPADVRGTGFLLIEHAGADDDRRLFLPALRRVKRISAAGSGGNFMSSDFTYYDIGMSKIDDWKYQWTEGKQIDGVACKGIQAIAASEKVKRDTGYTKTLWYVDPNRLLSLAAVYFDKDGMKRKELSVLRVEEISGVPFGTHLRMIDVITEHQSDMWFENLETNKGIDDTIFTERNLRKWRRSW